VQLAHLMQLRAEFGPALDLGSRRLLPFAGGDFAGERLTGEILPVGGDWVRMRPDGVAELDIRMTLRTGDGALIELRSSGLADISAGDRERILRGEDVDPSRYYFRTEQRFETGAPSYLWLNRMLAVGSGRRTRTGMVTQAYAVL
jgi:hypothetical protein